MSTKWNDGFAIKGVRLKKSKKWHRQGIPPDGIAHENHIVRFQIGDLCPQTGTSFGVQFFSGVVNQLLMVCWVALYGFYLEKIAANLPLNFQSHLFCGACLRKVNDECFFLCRKRLCGWGSAPKSRRAAAQPSCRTARTPWASCAPAPVRRR